MNADNEQTSINDAEANDVEANDVEEIDVEKSYPAREVVAKLRRLADALESERTFHIQIAGQRISVPPYATIEFEYERISDDEEIEIVLKWKNSS